MRNAYYYVVNFYTSVKTFFNFFNCALNRNDDFSSLRNLNKPNGSSAWLFNHYHCCSLVILHSVSSYRSTFLTFLFRLLSNSIFFYQAIEIDAYEKTGKGPTVLTQILSLLMMTTQIAFQTGLAFFVLTETMWNPRFENLRFYLDRNYQQNSAFIFGIFLYMVSLLE